MTDWSKKLDPQLAADLAYIEDAGILVSRMMEATVLEPTPSEHGSSPIAQRRDGWMPIASAPTTGEPVIIYTPRFGVEVRLADGEWWRMNPDLSTAPTFWMPLPSPPIERSEIGEATVSRAVAPNPTGES